MVLYSKLCIDFCHYFKLVPFFSPSKGKKKKSKTKILFSGNSELHPNSCMLCMKVGLGNILSVQISVLIWLILMTKSNCSGDEGIKEKFQGFLYDFESGSCGCWPPLTGKGCLVFCYSNLNYSSWCHLFSFLKKEFLLNCYRWAVHSVHLDFLSAFLAFFVMFELGGRNHLKSLLRHMCFVFILPFQNLLKSVNK